MNTVTVTTEEPLVARLSQVARKVTAVLDFLSPAVDLLLRLWVANVFFKAGLTKIQSWESTVLLFTYEYSVPLLSPEIAAVLGAFTELSFPVLLALGLGGRFAAFVLFVFNTVAVISYPGLNAVGVEQHQIWGLMLLVTLLHGPGKLSLDHWIGARFSRI
ncbi:MAG: DoxX family protein [Gammaproteobacteria bacterium]